MNDVEFATWLTAEGGVATVPGSSFYHDGASGSRYVRFAFCKKRETLEAAVERLANLRALV
jgi:aminotransferase